MDRLAAEVGLFVVKHSTACRCGGQRWVVFCVPRLCKTRQQVHRRCVMDVDAQRPHPWAGTAEEASFAAPRRAR